MRRWKSKEAYPDTYDDTQVAPNIETAIACGVYWARAHTYRRVEEYIQWPWPVSSRINNAQPCRPYPAPCGWMVCRRWWAQHVGSHRSRRSCRVQTFRADHSTSASTPLQRKRNGQRTTAPRVGPLRRPQTNTVERPDPSMTLKDWLDWLRTTSKARYLECCLNYGRPIAHPVSFPTFVGKSNNKHLSQ